MKGRYKPATENDIGECMNLLPTKEGTLKPINPTKNAVIVQLVKEGADYRHIVSIECVDEGLYPQLKEEAMRIFEGIGR